MEVAVVKCLHLLVALSCAFLASCSANTAPAASPGHRSGPTPAVAAPQVVAGTESEETGNAPHPLRQEAVHSDDPALDEFLDRVNHVDLDDEAQLLAAREWIMGARSRWRRTRIDE